MVVWFAKKHVAFSALIITDQGYHEDKNIHWVNFTVDPDSHIFKGHFPDQPILPGVCLFDAAFDLMSDQIQKKANISLRSIRLLKAILPGMHGSIEIENDIDNCQFKTQVFVSNKLVASFILQVESKIDKLDLLLNYSTENVIDLSDRIQRLPHKEPVKLVDHALKLSDKTFLTSRYMGRDDDLFKFSDHQNSYIPPAAIIESFLQSGALILDEYLAADSLTIFANARSINFLSKVEFGAKIEHFIQIKIQLENAVIIDGLTFHDGKIISEYKSVTLAIRPVSLVIPQQSSPLINQPQILTNN
jgi:3-hydroxymyristoyl/3-hydroxydecanoyl-(acyl carrier protein) dehydratase